MKKYLNTFKRTTCLKINVLSVLTFIILFSFSVFFSERVFSQSVESSEIDNEIGSFMLIIILNFLIGLTWFLYSIAIPAFIPLFERFSDNLKSILGLFACNIAIMVFLFTNYTIQLAIFYAVPVFLGVFITLYLRYNFALKKEYS